jgi:rSAM/selenodomain-associated transferase 1
MIGENSRAVILLFAKAPETGRVKTRLAAHLGAERASRIHRACLEDAIRLVERVPGCTRRLLLAGSRRAWIDAGTAFGTAWEIEPQRGRDLGERLERAFREAFRRGAKKAIAIGTDTPWMGARRIERAIAALDRNDAVLGPAADGGYYLVGMRRTVSAAFRQIAWGKARVLEQTRRALERAGASYELLARDFDLDRFQDLERAAEFLRRDPERAPVLAAWLRVERP